MFVYHEWFRILMRRFLSATTRRDSSKMDTNKIFFTNMPVLWVARYQICSQRINVDHLWKARRHLVNFVDGEARSVSNSRRTAHKKEQRHRDLMGTLPKWQRIIWYCIFLNFLLHCIVKESSGNRCCQNLYNESQSLYNKFASSHFYDAFVYFSK